MRQRKTNYKLNHPLLRVFQVEVLDFLFSLSPDSVFTRNLFSYFLRCLYELKDVFLMQYVKRKKQGYSIIPKELHKLLFYSFAAI